MAVSMLIRGQRIMYVVGHAETDNEGDADTLQADLYNEMRRVIPPSVLITTMQGLKSDVRLEILS